LRFSKHGGFEFLECGSLLFHVRTGVDLQADAGPAKADFLTDERFAAPLQKLTIIGEPKNGGWPAALSASQRTVWVFNCCAVYQIGDNCHCCKHLRLKKKTIPAASQPPFLE
jgi:hypothetical protein